MTRRRLEIRVGFFVVLAAVIAVVGTMWFQQFKLTEQRYHFSVRFSEVGGLVAGDPIYVSGVESGRVRSIELHPGYVVTEVGVREGVSVPVDSRIDLKSVGIMGERFVSITRGPSPRMAAPGDTLEGQFLAGLSEVMGSVGAIIEDIAVAARDLREVTAVLAGEGLLEETMENLADASSDMRDITAENRPRLSSALERFESVAAMMDSLVTTHYDSVDSSLAAFGRAGAQVEVTVDNLTAVSAEMRAITDSLQAGHGTLGRLIKDDTIGVRLEAAISRLDSLIADIQRHPHKYVLFKLF